MKKLLKTLFTTVLLTLLAALLTPVLYFTWRAGQPMELSKYNGLTYYQYIEWRNMAYEDSVTKYQTNHPEKVIERPWSCIGSNLLNHNISNWYISVMIMYAQDHPEVTRTWTPEEMAMIPESEVTVYNYLQGLWQVREKLIWAIDKDNPQGIVPYCRIQPDVPTLDEFQAMKQAHALAAAP